MEYTKSIEIDFTIGGGEKTVTVKQLDKQSRYLELVPQYNGDKIDIRKCTAKLYAERPDRKVIVQDCDINEEGNIAVEITEEIAALDGTVRCDIKLYEDDAVFSSAVFYLFVAESIMKSNIIYAYQNRDYETYIKIKNGRKIYTLGTSEKLIFGMRKSGAKECLLQKEIVPAAFDEEIQGYRLTLSAEELDIREGDYFYDVALKKADGSSKKVIRKTPIKICESVWRDDYADRTS